MITRFGDMVFGVGAAMATLTPLRMQGLGLMFASVSLDLLLSLRK